MKNTSLTVLPGILIGIAILMPTSAYAYLDPGAGTFALQGLIAIVAGGMVAIRAYWDRLRTMFGGSKMSSDLPNKHASSDGDA